MSYSLIDILTMFWSNFGVVFLLGLQSKNVMHSRYVAAVVTSFGISIAQFIFVKYAATGNLTVFFVCAAGGCAGIAASILFHDKVIARKYARGGIINTGPQLRFGEKTEGYMPLPKNTIPVTLHKGQDCD